MDGRERLLTALANGKPDRLPVQVHNWMAYYLDNYLGGCDALAAYERFGMDKVLYVGPRPEYSPADLARWQAERRTVGHTPEGDTLWVERIATPEGDLVGRGARNAMTEWQTECLIKTPHDFALFERYAPAPIRLDPAPVIEAQRRVGAEGIVRGWAAGYGQGSPWQDLCILMGTEQAILSAIDDPAFTHHALGVLLEKRLRFVELLQGVPLDLVEAGGGAASNTVISPRLFREFVLPYDVVQTEALHAAGMRVVYHLCGGLMHMLEMVAEMGADGLETMTPPGMGGDCDLAEAERRVGRRLFFVGGFDQSTGLERGTPEAVREQVFALHAACPEGGYVCSPSDHFFHGDPENLAAFVAAARECVYA